MRTPTSKGLSRRRWEVILSVHLSSLAPGSCPCHNRMAHRSESLSDSSATLRAKPQWRTNKCGRLHDHVWSALKWQNLWGILINWNCYFSCCCGWQTGMVCWQICIVPRGNEMHTEHNTVWKQEHHCLSLNNIVNSRNCWECQRTSVKCCCLLRLFKLPWSFLGSFLLTDVYYDS